MTQFDDTAAPRFQNSYNHREQRQLPKKKGRDDFPSHPWATRALFEYGVPGRLRRDLERQTVLEPCCGRGHMVAALRDYFGHVEYSDKFDYGTPGALVRNFMKHDWQPESYDWIVMNPPFRLARQFIKRALRLRIARVGLAVLVKTSFIATQRRYEEIYKVNPFSRMVQLVPRMAMVQGRIDSKASTATEYCWLVWLFDRPDQRRPEILWIPAEARDLKKRGDYRQHPLANRKEK